MGYKVKRIMVWQNGQEKQVRPYKWSPGTNTLAYYPLKDNISDATGKTTISGTLAKSGLGYKATANSNFNYGEQANYFNYWMCVNSYTTSGHTMIGTDGRSGGYYANHLQSDLNKKIFSFYNSSYNRYSVSFQPTTGTRHNISVGYTGEKTIYSIDGVVYDFGPNPGYSFSYNFWWDATDISISKLIVEKVCWTADEISNYYNGTKGDYGL